MKLKKIRESFDFTQKQMADVLGVHHNAYQKMEYGKVPKYIKNYALCLKALNENKLFKRHLKIIGVTWAEEKQKLYCVQCNSLYKQLERVCPVCKYENWKLDIEE